MCTLLLVQVSDNNPAIPFGSRTVVSPVKEVSVFLTRGRQEEVGAILIRKDLSS